LNKFYLVIPRQTKTRCKVNLKESPFQKCERRFLQHDLRICVVAAIIATEITFFRDDKIFGILPIAMSETAVMLKMEQPNAIVSER
jgi:hypothetical protein